MQTIQDMMIRAMNWRGRMSDRLTRNDGGLICNVPCDTGEYCSCDIAKNAYIKLAHYEDLEEQGRLHEATDMAISALEHQKWIPCSERLPEEAGTYLVTMDGDICGDDDPLTSICGFENGKWDEGDMVLAWMTLPEPYREEQR